LLLSAAATLGATPVGTIPRKTVVFRLWAVFLCIIGFMYAWLAEGLAGSAASGLSSAPWFELVYRSTLLFLLLVGYWAMGYIFQRQRTPLRSMGLIRRATAAGEFGTGAAFGWGAMVVCVLPMAVIGGFTVTFWTGPRQFGLLFLDLAVLLVAALAEEVMFRGYPFQRLIDGVGPVMATLIASALFAFRHLGNPDSSLASTLVTVVAGWLFAIAYLRTRALWLPWGLHFAWNASMGILFGLPISGLRIFSPVISTNPHGPLWLTGDGYGPEGSAVAAVVLLGALGVLMWVTRDYAWEYAQPVIIAGGIPVDIDAAAKRQHEEAMASPGEVAAPQLVQILPAGGVVSTPSESAPRVEDISSESGPQALDSSGGS
jgi:membrane protease YdiL (CAAX protease family)